MVQSARHAFLRALSARRSVVQDVGPAFFRFCRVFWWLLDACQQHEDSRAAQTVLILSETFHQIIPGVQSSVTQQEIVQSTTNSDVTTTEQTDKSTRDQHDGTEGAAAAVDVLPASTPAVTSATRQYVQVREHENVHFCVLRTPILVLTLRHSYATTPSGALTFGKSPSTVLCATKLAR